MRVGKYRDGLRFVVGTLFKTLSRLRERVWFMEKIGFGYRYVYAAGYGQVRNLSLHIP